MAAKQAVKASPPPHAPEACAYGSKLVSEAGGGAPSGRGRLHPPRGPAFATPIVQASAQLAPLPSRPRACEKVVQPARKLVPRSIACHPPPSLALAERAPAAAPTHAARQ